MATQRAPYGRVFSFGKGLDIDSRAIPRGSIGWIDPDFDGLDDAEAKVGDNFQPHVNRDLSGN